MQPQLQANRQQGQPKNIAPIGSLSAKRKAGRPTGSGAASAFTPEEQLEFSTQRLNHGFLLVPDLMRIFNRGDQWVKDLVNSGKLPAKKLGHEYVVTWDAVQQFIALLPDVSDPKTRRATKRTKAAQSAPLPSA
jgi:hypothetical protein